MIGTLRSACGEKASNGVIIRPWGNGGEKVAIWNIFSLYVFISENVWYVHLELSRIWAQSVGKSMTECSDKPLLTAAFIPGVTLPLHGGTSHLSQTESISLHLRDSHVQDRRGWWHQSWWWLDLSFQEFQVCHHSHIRSCKWFYFSSCYWTSAEKCHKSLDI